MKTFCANDGTCSCAKFHDDPNNCQHGVPAYSIKLYDGKYTVINEHPGGLRILRYGEPWPAAEDMRWNNVMIAMAGRIEELETGIKPLQEQLRLLLSYLGALQDDDIEPEDVMRPVEETRNMLKALLEPKP